MQSVDIKVESGKLVISIPLQEINGVKDKEKIGALVGEKLTQLMQWVEDKEFRSKETLKECEYDILIDWLFNGHNIDVNGI